MSTDGRRKRIYLDEDHENSPRDDHVSTMSNSMPPIEESSPLNKKQKLSLVWNDYYVVGKGSNKRAQCKHCPKSYAIGDGKGSYGTGNLNRHAKRCKNKGARTNQCEEASPFEQEVYREKMAVSMMKHNYPFLMVEHQATRDLHAYLNPNVRPYTRNTAKNDCLKIYKREKEELKKILDNVPGKVCLTSDVWSSSTRDSFIGLTAHYVDVNWKLHSKILNFHHFPPPHTGRILSDQVFQFLKDWGLESKVFSLTLDNDSSNNNMQLYLKAKLRGNLVCDGEYFHARCCAHILNLIVQDGLRIASDALDNIRTSVHFVKASEGRRMKFVDCCIVAGVPFESGLRLDCVTRWNSTYKMLESALKYCEAFVSYNEVEPQYEFCPSSYQWDVAARIAEFLKPFSIISDLFSGSNYPTSNLYFHQVWKIHKLLIHNSNCDFLEICEMASNMLPKFKKYWEDYSMILSLAVILDPRYKLQFVKFCLNKIGERDSLVNEKLENMVKVLKSLFDEYVAKRMRGSSQGTPSSNLDVGMDTPTTPRLVDVDIDEFETQIHTSGSSRSEVDIYLEEKKLSAKKNLNILKYWKRASQRFPTLSLLARDIMTIPITTVASESAFSIGAKVLSKYRSSLLPDNAEALICGRNWLNGYEVESDEPTDDELIVPLISVDDSRASSSLTTMSS